MTTTTASKEGLSTSQTCVLQNRNRKSTANTKATKVVVGGGARLVNDDDDDADKDGASESSDDDDKQESLTAIFFPFPSKDKPPSPTLLVLPSPPASSSSASLITPFSSSSILALSPPAAATPQPSSSSLPSTSILEHQNSSRSSPPSCTCFVVSSSSSSSLPSAAATAASRLRQQQPPPPSPPSPPPTTEGAAADMAILVQPYDVQSSLTEIDMMRAQEKKQSAEIMTLKTELDALCGQLKTLEKVNEELNTFKTESEKQKMVKATEILTMEKDFQQLSKKHDRLVKVKDSAKEQNQLMEDRISKMSVENPSKLSKVLKEKSVLVQQLNRSVSKAKLKLRELETVYSQKLFERENNSELEKANLLQSVHQRTKHELEKKIESAQAEMEDQQRALKESILERKKNEEETLRRREKLIEQKMEAEMKTEKLCQQIKEVKAERIEHEKEYLEVKKKLISVKGGFAAQEWKTDKEAIVKELKKQLATLKIAKNEAAKAFLAYKKHADHLINRERTLNKKFSEINSKHTS